MNVLGLHQPDAEEGVLAPRGVRLRPDARGHRRARRSGMGTVRDARKGTACALGTNGGLQAEQRDGLLPLPPELIPALLCVAIGQQPWYAPAVARLLDTIRAAIRDSGQTPASIARRAQVARSQLSRLLSGERGVSVEAMERLADALGLEVVIRPRRSRKRR